MSKPQDEVQADRAAPAEHVEMSPGKHDHDVILKSSYDDLGMWATVKRFRKVCCSVSRMNLH